MKRKIKTTTSTFYCYFCSRHILITFVGMTLLIVNYGVNTVQMSAVPHRNGNCNNSNNICSSGSGNNIVSSINGNNTDNKNNSFGKLSWKRSVEKLTNLNRNTNTNSLHIALPATPTAYKDSKYAEDDSNDNYADTNYYNLPNIRLKASNNNIINHTETDLVAGQFGNLRKSRIFGLLGSNFSLSYNLSLNSGTSTGNITVAAPAPAYYYAPAAYYPYGYYNPYGYYDPYAYNPYAYNPYAYNPYDPYAGYGYYG
ncbi:probable serine/threonine-protein kinase clkA [Lucilia sericata]|uniref:probable serine/threonine-protein kinase clkA n=1 Tax=Lucilia sericata TaxID=13632 RepID=UPI0018A81B2F|nr:probable serine/threonine-protein kinase clkA [Lucilia sericata]